MTEPLKRENLPALQCAARPKQLQYDIEILLASTRKAADPPEFISGRWMELLAVDTVIDTTDSPLRKSVFEHLSAVLRNDNDAEEVGRTGVVLCHNVAMPRPGQITALIEHHMTDSWAQSCQVIHMEFRHD